MNALVQLYRRLDQVQRKLWVKVLATVIFLGLWGGAFGYLLSASYSIEAQQNRLAIALADQSIDNEDVHAYSLSRSGTVTIGGKTYGGAWFRDRYQLFERDEDGNDIGMVQNPRLQAMRLVAADRPNWEPVWLVDQPGTTWLLTVSIGCLLVLIVWSNLLLPYLLTAAGTAVAASIAQVAGAAEARNVCIVIGNLLFAFMLLTRTASVLLQSPRQVFAVAHTVVKEASRSWISLAFIVILLILLPLLPLMLDGEDPLRYRVQTLLAQSSGLTFVAAACMTLFLSCGTVAFEIRDRQIWQLVSKPLNRFSYLAGKWLGVMVINLILLVIAGLCTFFNVQQLRMQPVAAGLEGQLDVMQMQDQVLTARLSSFPDFPKLDSGDMVRRIDQVITNDPELSQLEVVPRSARRRIARDLLQQFDSEQRSIPPMVEGGLNTKLYRFKEFEPGQPHNVCTYHFSGLGPARGLTATLTLRYRFYILANDEHQRFNAAFYFNGDQSTAVPVEYVPTMSHTLPLPSSLIRDDGTLTVSVVNFNRAPPGGPVRGEINFDADGLEVIYRAGTFEGNFFRAVLMHWVRLAFLSAIGICLATFLSFPVACLFAFTIFIAGALGPFLATSLETYYPPVTATMDWGDLGLVIQWAFQWMVKSIAQLLVFMLQGFGEYKPTQMLVEGRLIPWTQLGMALAKLGGLWSGPAMLIGYLVIRSRQLAIYSGHG